MSQGCSIAIVGGGLGGLAAANALAAVGLKAEVFEAAPVLGEIGAGINTNNTDATGQANDKAVDEVLARPEKANLTDFAGVDGIYDFKANPERGLGSDSAIVVRYDAKTKAWAWLTKPGGEPLK